MMGYFFKFFWFVVGEILFYLKVRLLLRIIGLKVAFRFGVFYYDIIWYYISFVVGVLLSEVKVGFLFCGLDLFYSYYYDFFFLGLNG